VDKIKSASVYWDGGYIRTDSVGLTGKHRQVQQALIKAVKAGKNTVVTAAMDELPIRFG